jgi:hypothetical protein
MDNKYTDVMLYNCNRMLKYRNTNRNSDGPQQFEDGECITSINSIIPNLTVNQNPSVVG